MRQKSIDELIAEHVMGWENNYDHPGGSQEPYMWGVMDWYSPTEPARAANFPCYSGDIAFAFEVVEKMHEQVYANGSAVGFPKPPVWKHANYLALSCLSGSNDYAATFCCLGAGSEEWHEAPEQLGGARAGSAAMAICLAALKAIGIEVPA